MNQGNGGLLALCGLLGVIAFGVLFVAPRFLEPATEQAVVEETAVEEAAGLPETAPAVTASEPSGGDQTAEGRQDRTVADEEAASEAPAVADQQAAPADEAAGAPAAIDEMTQAPTAAEPAVEADADAQASGETSETAAGVSADPSEPGFDLLRVEPDGSTVIAGRAEPGTRVDVMNGEDVVASADVGPSGDFAAVFDEPLEPGDYQLTLRVTGDDQPEVFSEEVATISIPRDGGSELLAMVTRPGEASRIVNAPSSGGEAMPQASNDVSQTPAAETSAAEGEELTTPTADAVGEMAQQEEDAASAAEVPADSAESAPAVSDAQADVAALAPAPEQEAAQAPAASTAQVRIDAVEVEDERLFVAGSSPRGTEVRVYADDQLIGDDRANSEGRFLVEGRMALSVGEHTIRADLVDPSRTVVARALVPFDRPEGGMAAAIAAAEAPPMGEDIAVVTEPSPPAVETPEDRLAAAAPDEASTGGETTAPGRTDRVAATGPAESAPGTSAPDASAPQPAVEAPSSEDPTTSGDTSPAFSPAGEADTASSEAPVPAETETAAAQPADEPVTVTQEALTPSPASVIIRRGDTLWQISRRVYGQGVRYTTIYLANQQQIADPDRILPGQIFSVPDEALENSEQLHRDRLRAN
jgi:nucleoid-associated protein YgaU